MENTIKKLVYEAPTVEALAARVERGFSGSTIIEGSTIEEFTESGYAKWT